MPRGHLIFANNNEEIDYTAIALCNALMIKHNLKEKAVALVTDKWSHERLIDIYGKTLVKKAFDHIIFGDHQPTKQYRNFNDTKSTRKELSWNNHARASAYDLSPFTETVLLDADYLVLDKSLDHVWGKSEFMINKKAITLEHKLPHSDEIYVEPFGIPMYWATCVYFRKGDTSEILFDMIEHIRDNYDFYRMLYRLPGRLFRNDYAFSIALHTLSNCMPDGVDSLPCDTLLTSFDSDELIDVRPNEFIFLVNDVNDQKKFRACNVKETNVHVMNKFSIGRMVPKLLEIYGA